MEIGSFTLTQYNQSEKIAKNSKNPDYNQKDSFNPELNPKVNHFKIDYQKTVKSLSLKNYRDEKKFLPEHFQKLDDKW